MYKYKYIGGPHKCSENADSNGCLIFEKYGCLKIGFANMYFDVLGVLCIINCYFGCFNVIHHNFLYI